MEDAIGLSAAIGAIASMATEKLKTEFIDKSPERKGAYYIVGPDGKATLKIAAPDWHREKLATPTELRKFIEDHDSGFSATFYDESRITYVYNLSDRRDVAVTELVISPQYQWLLKNSGQSMTQKDFVRLLRINFRGATDGTLLSLVRNLKFSSAGDLAGSIQQGRESMQRSVLNEVRGEAAIPEEVSLAIPVFENHNLVANVACAIEVMPAEQQFRLTPFPLSLKIAMDTALADVASLLGAEGMPPLYRGSPS